MIASASARVFLAIIAIFRRVCVRASGLSTVVTVDVERGSPPIVEIIVTHDALAYALNDTSVRVTDPQMYALLEGPIDQLAWTLQDARERFVDGVDILVDDQRVTIELVSSPDVQSIEQWKIDHPSMRLPIKMDFVARCTLPTDAKMLRIRLPVVFDEVFLTLSRPGTEPIYVPLSAGETSPAFDLRSANL